MVKIVSSVAEGVDVCDAAIGIILHCHGCAPGIVGIGCDLLCILVYDGNNVALQILHEVVRNIVVKDTADRILVVIQRSQDIAIPLFPQDLGAVKGIGVLDTVNRLAGADAVGIVGVRVRVEALKLSAFLPRKSVAEISDRVALCIVGDRLTVEGRELV